MCVCEGMLCSSALMENDHQLLPARLLDLPFPVRPQRRLPWGRRRGRRGLGSLQTSACFFLLLCLRNHDSFTRRVISTTLCTEGRKTCNSWMETTHLFGIFVFLFSVLELRALLFKLKKEKTPYTSCSCFI